MARLKAGVLISGRGSNLQALIDACAAPDFPAEIVLVISNNADAKGLRRAERAGIETRIIDHRTFDSRESFDAALDEALAGAGVEFVCMAGFMRLLSEWFAERWRDRLINIHPSLLPAFRGLNVHERMIEAGARFGGCTVHFVRAAVDEGPIIIQAVVPVLPDDDGESLARRVLVAEHRVFPAALRMAAEGKLRIVGDRVLIQGAAAEPGVLYNPDPNGGV
jgi:phosphoribosylglycinamide formyltransferase-1